MVTELATIAWKRMTVMGLQAVDKISRLPSKLEKHNMIGVTGQATDLYRSIVIREEPISIKL